MPDIITLSSTHIKYDTVEFLNSQSIHKTCAAITVHDSMPQGWTIEVDKNQFDNTECSKLPNDLGICILYVLDHGHTTFNLDPSGNIIPYMPRYKYAACDNNGHPSLEFCYCGPALLACNILNPYVQLSVEPAETEADKI